MTWAQQVCVGQLKGAHFRSRFAKSARYAFLIPTPVTLTPLQRPHMCKSPLKHCFGCAFHQQPGITKTDLPVKTAVYQNHLQQPPNWLLTLNRPPAFTGRVRECAYPPFFSINRAADSLHIMTHLQLGPFGGRDCFQETCMKGWLQCSRTWSGIATFCIVLHRFLILKSLKEQLAPRTIAPSGACHIFHPRAHLQFGWGKDFARPMEWNAHD